MLKSSTNIAELHEHTPPTTAAETATGGIALAITSGPSVVRLINLIENHDEKNALNKLELSIDAIAYSDGDNHRHFLSKRGYNIHVAPTEMPRIYTPKSGHAKHTSVLIVGKITAVSTRVSWNSPDKAKFRGCNYNVSKTHVDDLKKLNRLIVEGTEITLIHRGISSEGAITKLVESRQPSESSTKTTKSEEQTEQTEQVIHPYVPEFIKQCRLNPFSEYNNPAWVNA